MQEAAGLSCTQPAASGLLASAAKGRAFAQESTVPGSQLWVLSKFALLPKRDKGNWGWGW